jgi:hypothetical protein
VEAPPQASPRRGCGGKAAARTLSLACVASEAAGYSDILLEERPARRGAIGGTAAPAPAAGAVAQALIRDENAGITSERQRSS